MPKRESQFLDGPLISVEGLASLLASAAPPPTLLDVRWRLGPGAERDAYVRGHLPGAVFVDLDTDLAAPPGPRGRHPLPDPEVFAAAMRAAGVSIDRGVVVYDEASSLAAARAWWLLRYFGHDRVAVLDGGLSAWVAAGQQIETGVPLPPTPGNFVAVPGRMAVIDAGQAAELAAGSGILLDARAPERFSGLTEPVDPVAGHIPGAKNRPTTDNVHESGGFLEPTVLRGAFEQLGARPGVEVGVYCGSGVTAAHEVLALALAGQAAALYPGSWSEWITDPDRPVARSHEAG